MSNKVIFNGNEGLLEILDPNPNFPIELVIAACLPRIALEDFTLTVGVLEPVSGKKGDQIDLRIAELNNVPFADKLPSRVISLQDLPKDTSFAEAWAYDSSSSPELIDLHVERAKEISIKRIRAARVPLFDILDDELRNAEERKILGADVEEELRLIVGKKEALRTATDGVKAFSRVGTTMQISSGEQLKALELLPGQTEETT